MTFKVLVKINIEKQGFHVTNVIDGIVPRFAYSIGLYERYNFELVFSGGVYYLYDQILPIFKGIVDNLDNSVFEKKYYLKC